MAEKKTAGKSSKKAANKAQSRAAAGRMHKTAISMGATDRAKLVEILNAELADATDLYTQTKHAHWNVKGPQFIALHELFDMIATDLLVHIDNIAERATTLGGVAYGTARAVAERTRLAELDSTAVDGTTYLEALIERYAAFGGSVRAAIDVASNLGDMDTADLFTEVSRAIDKDLWFLEAHLQG